VLAGLRPVEDSAHFAAPSAGAAAAVDLEGMVADAVEPAAGGAGEAGDGAEPMAASDEEASDGEGGSGGGGGDAMDETDGPVAPPAKAKLATRCAQCPLERARRLAPVELVASLGAGGLCAPVTWTLLRRKHAQWAAQGYARELMVQVLLLQGQQAGGGAIYGGWAAQPAQGPQPEEAGQTAKEGGSGRRRGVRRR